MKTHLTLSTITLAALLCAGAAVASDADSQTPQTYVKDSAITTKVKANLAADHASNLTKIHVDTDANGVVFLTGTVDSSAIAARAVSIAEKTDGVRSVHSDIKVVAAN
jgi:hyperosmotically inducible periplasmic protein